MGVPKCAQNAIGTLKEDLYYIREKSLQYCTPKLGQTKNGVGTSRDNSQNYVERRERFNLYKSQERNSNVKKWMKMRRGSSIYRPRGGCWVTLWLVIWTIPTTFGAAHYLGLLASWDCFVWPLFGSVPTLFGLLASSNCLGEPPTQSGAFFGTGASPLGES